MTSSAAGRRAIAVARALESGEVPGTTKTAGVRVAAWKSACDAMAIVHDMGASS